MVSGIIPNSAGLGRSGSAGAGAAVLVRRRSRAAVTAQMARAAMTSTVCRAIAGHDRLGGILHEYQHAALPARM